MCVSFDHYCGNSLHLLDSPGSCSPNRCHLRLLETACDGVPARRY